MVFFKNISILFILGKSRTKIIIIRNNQKTENLQHEMITRNENWTWKEIRNDSFAWPNRTTGSRSPWSHRVIDKVRLENWTRVSLWRNSAEVTQQERSKYYFIYIDFWIIFIYGQEVVSLREMKKSEMFLYIIIKWLWTQATFRYSFLDFIFLTSKNYVNWSISFTKFLLK